ncbi:MAG: hypothetical protein ACYDA1_10360, partial [Vulcanimicrobiaceae bacterium]
KMSKDEIRASVLRFYYEHNEQAPGGHAQTVEVVRATGIGNVSVLEAQQYLVDKGMLSSREAGQQVRSLGQPGVSAFLARITSSGIDFIENPGEFSSSMPSALISIVAGGDVHLAGRDQQSVRGDVSGGMAQGDSTVTLTPFPIEPLRALLANEPEALQAIEEINSEIVKAKPVWSKILGAVEIIKGAGSIGEVGKILGAWLSTPSISSAIQHFVQSVIK